MYYRRKILLSFLQVFDNQLEKLRLQKLLLLVSKLQDKPSFEFVPYKYGCYSFQSNADLCTMMKYGQVSKKENVWFKTNNENYLSQLKEKDRKIILEIKRLYGHLTSNELIKYTYIHFPYYATHSRIAGSLLSLHEYIFVKNYIPDKKETTLFTIGYEGRTLENYLNRLIINGVKVLCDVRKNSISMKFGFSKSQLKFACEGVGIKYFHFPEFGIESNKRKVLDTQRDYDKLFDEYKDTILRSTEIEQFKLLNLLKKEKRIALTCFEANIHQCHRKHLAESIASLPDFNYQLTHI